jgi:predicted cobalt transporter CbtA
MLVGLLAGLLVFLSARLLGEAEVDRAIALEAQADRLHGEAPEPELISRSTQKGAGLLTGLLVYGTALGGIFGLVFAYSHGRLGPNGPRALAATLAAAGFVVVSLVPTLKYPANPPAVGNPDTMGTRTAAFFFMILVSVLASILACQLGRPLVRRLGAWNGTLLAIAIFILTVGLVAHWLPVIDEVPPTFPADLLWRFRIASWAMQAVLWAAIGLLFGWLTERDPRWRTTST